MSGRTTRAQEQANNARAEAEARAARGSALTEPEPEAASEEVANKPLPKPKRKRRVAGDVEPATEPKKTTRAKASARANTKKKVQQVVAEDDDDMDLDGEDEQEVVDKPAKKQKIAAAAKAATKVATSKTTRPKRGTRVATKESAKAPEAAVADPDAMDVDDALAMADATAPPPWLAVFTSSLNSKFDSIGGKFDGIDGKFDEQIAAINANHKEQTTQFNTKFDEQTSSFDTKLVTVTTKLGSLGTGMETVDSSVRDVQKDIQTVNGSIRDMQQQVEIIADKVKDVQDTIQQHSRDIAKNEQEINVTNKRVDGISNEVKELSTKLQELLEQAYPRDQGESNQGETKETLVDLASTCMNTEERMKTNFKTMLRKIDGLKQMVRVIENRTRGLVQEVQVDHNNDSDHDKDPDRDLSGDHDSQSDSDDDDDDDSDESGNGDGGVIEAWNEVIGEYRNGTTPHKPEESYHEDSAAEQLHAELRAANTTTPQESTTGGQYSTTRPNVDRLETEEEKVDHSNSTIIETPNGESHGQQNILATPKQDEAGVVTPAKPKLRRVMRRMNPQVGPEDKTEDITFTGAPEFDPNLPNRQIGGQSSTVAQLLPVAPAVHYQASTKRFKGEDTELDLEDTKFNEEDVDATSTPCHTPLASSKSGSKVLSQARPATPSSRKPRRSLHQTSVVHNAGKIE